MRNKERDPTSDVAWQDLPSERIESSMTISMEEDLCDMARREDVDISIFQARYKIERR